MFSILGVGVGIFIFAVLIAAATEAAMYLFFGAFMVYFLIEGYKLVTTKKEEDQNE